MDTSYILEQGERAEIILDDLNEIIYHLKEIAERLDDSGSCSESAMAEFLPIINESIFIAEHEKQECENAIAQAQAIEDRSLEREYLEARL